jgi:replicative DNA helicase
MVQKRQKADEPDRLPPQDLEAERCVLGSVLIQNRAVDEVADFLAPEHFYADCNRKLFEAVRDMHERGIRGIDAVTIRAELEKRGTLEAVGGVPYILQVLEAVPHAAHVEYYGRIVQRKWQARSATDTASRGLNRLMGGDDPDEVIPWMERELFSIAENSASAGKVAIADILEETFARILVRMETPGTVSGQPTGFSGLDDLLSGFQASELIILAARPSMGKTALVCNFALSMAIKGCGVLLFSLEQSKLELAERLLCIQARINGHKLRQGDLSPEEHQELNTAAAFLGGLPIFIDDLAGQNMTRISAVARRMKRAHNIGVVIIDYLQLIEAEDRGIPREQQISSITRRLKFLAKDLSVPVIALGQLNRGVENREDKKPKLSDLRESGAIEQDADIVMFLHRPDAYDPEVRPGEADLIVAKNRSGPVGTAPLTWMKTQLKFVDRSNLPEPEGEF